MHSLDSDPVMESTVTAACDATKLALTVHGGLIKGTSSLKFYPVTNQMNLRNCTVQVTGTAQSAIQFGAASGANTPILRDCVLVSGATATQSIDVATAQDIIIYGRIHANKGAEPPTNVTFLGGGGYVVSASVAVDLP
jgi:hypothetical protein